MATMPIHEAMEDAADYAGVTAHRARAEVMLDQITGRARQALDAQGIDVDLFIMIPNSGDAIIAYGTTGDPSDELWNRAGMIVSEVVRDVVGVRRVRCRAVVCTHAPPLIDLQPHSDSSVQQRGAGA
jgi:hypothetical protein